MSRFGKSRPTKLAVIPHVAADYFVMRGTCCRDVTIYDDWYKTRFKQQISEK